MSDIAIQVENLSKAYQLGKIGTGTVSRDLERFFMTKVLGKEDPFLKIGQTNDRAVKGTSDIVWSLKDIDFSISQGDAVGIIGKNGAGKSTLLKILSRVTSPTTGNIKIKGRVASLLEVGTGFHPELSGKENIYLNGAILGMRKAEIKRKFDEIVDFSGVERYIDTPVKRYSSGMYVRLAFAVAAHLESEILIVDEVLAVGDAEFQKKCLGKMGDISKGEGRTILFVSHNMAAVKSLCKKGILLENGLMKKYGDVDSIVNSYFIKSGLTKNFTKINSNKDGFILNDFWVNNEGKQTDDNVFRDQNIEFNFSIDNQTNDTNIYFNIKLKDDEGKCFLVTASKPDEFIIKEGKIVLKMIIPSGFFNDGSYFVDLMVLSKNSNGYKVYFEASDVLSIQILPEQRALGTWMGKELGQIRHTFQWKI